MLKEVEMPKRSEDSFIIHNIIPLFSKLGYPSAGDHERIKVKEVPIYRPSGGRSGSTPDIVYYHNGEPLLLVEAKKEHRSHAEALKEAERYHLNFPREDKEYAPTGRRPRFIATTVGREIKFYRHRHELTEDGFSKPISEAIDILTFDELLKEYGLARGYKPKILSPELFKKEFLNGLIAAYNHSDDKRITPEVIKNVAWHILNYLENQKRYVSKYPFTEISEDISRYEEIRDIHKRFDLINSLGPDIAQEFRQFILRSFQGNEFNQYLTEPCVIAFMLNLLGGIEQDWKVMDFECGSGGFLAGVVGKGVPIENIMGVDIDELPYLIAKTYLTLYFKKSGVSIKDIPIRQDNGLFFLGNEWDLVIGNPAGSAKYEKDDIEEVLENLERDLDCNSKDDKFSEYNFSIQQAVRSCKVGGKICLVLPEGFFSNSQDEILRKYLGRHCKVLSIISLPRGVFRKGTSTRSINTGSQTSSQKMSILYAKKIREVIDGEGVEINDMDLNHPVFLANVSEPDSTAGKISDWLEPRLNIVLEEWRAWQAKQQLSEIDESLIKSAVLPIEPKKKVKIQDKQTSLFDKVIDIKKPKETKSEIVIDKSLKDLFKK